MLKERLSETRSKLGEDATWPEIIQAANAANVDLCVHYMSVVQHEQQHIYLEIHSEGLKGRKTTMVGTVCGVLPSLRLRLTFSPGRCSLSEQISLRMQVFQHLL